MRSHPHTLFRAGLLLLTVAVAVGAGAVVAPGAKALAPPGSGTCIPAQGCYPPSTPGGFKITTTTLTSASLRWTSDNSQESFDIQRRPPGGAWATVDSVDNMPFTTMTYTDGTLSANTAYCFRVLGWSVLGGWAASAEDCAVATNVPPPAPSGLSATAVSTTELAISWTDNAVNEKTSVVERRLASSTNWTTVASYGFSGTGVRSLTDGGLSPATSYCYRVRTWNLFGQAITPDACAKTKTPPPPAAPTLVQVSLSPIYSNSTSTYLGVGVWFRDNSTDETGFSVLQFDPSGTGPGPYVVNPISGSGTVQSVFMGWPVNPQTRYCYAVVAVNQWGASISPQSCFTIPAPPPAAPSNLQVSAVTDTTASLSWQDNSNDEDSFQITARGHVTAASAHPGTGPTSFTLTGLPANTNVCISLTAARMSAAGMFGSTPSSVRIESTPSNTVCVQTTLPSPPAAPSGLVATGKTLTSISLRWNDNSTNEDGFWVERQSGGSWTQIASLGAGSTTFTDSALAPGTMFCYRVTAHNQGGTASSGQLCTATASPLPDLVFGRFQETLADLQTDAGLLHRGDPFAMTWTECNTGTVTAAQHDDTYELSDGMGFDDKQTVSVQALVPGQCVLAYRYYGQGLAEGSYDVTVAIDSGNTVNESDKANNTGRLFFGILAPDPPPPGP